MSIACTFGCRKIKKNGRNLRDGRYWTHDSVSALTEVFPFWTRHQIEGIIKRCRDKGLILTAALSPRAYDRTNWYNGHGRGHRGLCRPDGIPNGAMHFPAGGHPFPAKTGMYIKSR